MSCSFDCVFYYVSDLERPISFYRDILGFTFVSRDVVARLEIDGVLFELVPATDQRKLQGLGNPRLALRVDDVQRATQELRAQGVLVSPAEDEGTGILAFLRDPDGNELCLWQYAA